MPIGAPARPKKWKPCVKPPAPKGKSPATTAVAVSAGLDAGPGRVVRLKIPTEGRVVFDDMVKGHIATDVSELDDMILRRSDGMPTYNMAVVVDDHDMGITHVIRGDDHVSNTPKQILIYQALGWNCPCSVMCP